jgi:hypothetical protein
MIDLFGWWSARFAYTAGLLWIGLVWFYSATAADFEASGVCKFENWTSDGAKFKTFTSHFTVQEDGGRWQIIHLPDGSPTYEEVMFDGADVYSITRDMVVDREIVRRTSNPEIAFRLTNGLAYSSTVCISSGAFPESAPHFPRLLWYAFLSGNVLRQSPMPQISAPWIGDLRETKSVGASVQWAGDQSLFPEEIRFVAADKLWSKVTTEMLPIESPKVPPFAEGGLAGIYQVRAWTNQNGIERLQLPAEFEVTRYFPPSVASNGLVCERYSCSVTNVGPLRNHIVPPELTEPCVGVLDQRFSDARYPLLCVTYQITNHTLRAKNDPALQPLVARYQRQCDDLRSKKIGLRGPSNARRTWARPYVLFGAA